MIDISKDTKQILLKDSSHKDLLIKGDNADVSGKNVYRSTSSWGMHLNLSPKQFKVVYSDDEKFLYITNYIDLSDWYEYKYVSYQFYISHGDDENITDIAGCIEGTIDGRTYRKHIVFSAEEINNSSYQNPLTMYAIIPSKCKNVMLYLDKSYAESTEYFKGGIGTQKCMVMYFNEEPEEMPIPYEKYQSSYENFPSIMANNMEDIKNSNVVTESFQLTESLCSSDNLKLGACESSVCTFKVVGRNDDFLGRDIYPYICVDIINPDRLKEVNFYKGSNPYPSYDYSRSTTWNNLNVSTRLWWSNLNIPITMKYVKDSDVICVKYKFQIQNIDEVYKNYYIMPFVFFYAHRNGGKTVSYINYFPDDFEASKALNSWMKISDVCGDYVTVYSYIYSHWENGVITDYLDCLGFIIRDENFNVLTGTANQVSVRVSQIQINILQDITEDPPAYDPNMCLEYYGKSVDDYVNIDSKIPLGKYTIRDVKTSYVRKVCTKTITAYDSFYKMSQNAFNWYSSYMFAMNMDAWITSYGFEYPRQIYSTYFNMANRHGWETRNQSLEEKLGEITPSSYKFKVERTCKQNANLENNVRYYNYFQKAFDVDSDYLYCVGDQVYTSYATEEHLKEEFFQGYHDYEDSLYRGLMSNGSVTVKEYDDDGNILSRYLVDTGDYFAISKDCTQLLVGYCMTYTNYNRSATTRFCDSISVYKVNKQINLKNASTRLVYYKYYKPQGIEDIFACDSNITVRDVIRSLLELCGCFYSLDRYGNSQFIYCEKSALYPSETLYPADNLYPRGTSELLPMNKYLSMECAEYTVKDIGRIQVKKNTVDNTGSICEWEYIGDADNENTYIIDDNIFLCNELMEYEQDSMPEMDQIMEGMYEAISNMGYSPNTTVAVGMPWLELGDRVICVTNTSGIEAFVFRRTLSGIQRLTDTFEAVGDEQINAINKYSWK